MKVRQKSDSCLICPSDYKNWYQLNFSENNSMSFNIETPAETLLSKTLSSNLQSLLLV